MKKTLLIITALMLVVGCDPSTEPEPEEETVTDIDGNVYETVQIGDQLWMAENLKVTKYNNGGEIPTGYSNEEWVGLITGAYEVYPLNSTGNVSTCEGDCAEVYGNLYNWFAVDDERGICPEGWHMPSDGEFVVLEEHLGMNVACQLAGNSDLWLDGYLEDHFKFGTSGFTALPGGFIYSVGIQGLSTNGYFWSSTGSTEGGAIAVNRSLHYNTTYVTRGNEHGYYGCSIRCLKD